MIWVFFRKFRKTFDYILPCFYESFLLKKRFIKTLGNIVKKFSENSNKFQKSYPLVRPKYIRAVPDSREALSRWPTGRAQQEIGTEKIGPPTGNFWKFQKTF